MENKKIQFSSKEEVSQLQNRMDKAVVDLDLELMDTTVQSINVFLQENSQKEKEQPELFQQLKDIRGRIGWYVLDKGTLSPELLEELFSQYFQHYFEHDPEMVLWRLQTRITFAYDFVHRDELKAKIRAALAQATATLGEEDIESVGSMVEPTVANWLRDWREFVGDRKVEPLLIVEYLNSNKNTKKLTEEQRKQLEQILKLDHTLSLSSKTKEGNENTFFMTDPVSGTYKMYERGKLTDTHIPIPKEELEAMRYVAGLDDKGRTLSMADVVRREVRYEQPVSAPPQIPEEPKQSPLPTPPAPPTPKPTPVPAPQVPIAKPKKQKIAKPPTPLTPPKPKPSAATTKMDYHAIAERVLSAIQLLLPSVQIERRFLHVVSAFAEGKSTEKETAELLKAPIEEGGVNIDTAQVELVMTTTKEIIAESKSNPQKIFAQYKEPTEHFTPTFQQVQGKIHQEDVHHAANVSSEQIEDIFANINPMFDEAMQQQMASRPPKEPEPVNDIAAPVNDVHAVVMGPVDELANMNPTELRRLSETKGIRDGMEKVIQKFHLLEQESVAKKAEGIDAWKKSPLNQLYVRIGNQSLEKGLSVSEVITKMQKAGEDVLTQEEFDAVADINKQIRF